MIRSLSLRHSATRMDYNSRLSAIVDKGECGDPETFDSASDLKRKVKRLAVLIQGSKRVVAFTGAGISTSCGIPDFRGPNGLWTKEQRGEATAAASNQFDSARPSFTHFALACLVHLGVITRIISQNVDSLHLRSGVPNSRLSELHGNIFKEKCLSCGHEYLRDFDVGGMGLKPTGRLCDTGSCRGVLCDEAVDWDTELDDDIFQEAEDELDTADLVISMGTSLRVEPAAALPERVLEYNPARSWGEGKIVIINLQKTDRDQLADVRIFHYCDDVMRHLCRELGLTLVDTTQIQGDDVAAWYTVNKNSVLEKMVQRKEEEKRLPKPQDTVPPPTSKRRTGSKKSPPAVAIIDESPPRKEAKRKHEKIIDAAQDQAATHASKKVVAQTGKKKAASASSNSSVTSTTSSSSSVSKKGTQIKPPASSNLGKPPASSGTGGSSFKCLSFAEILERNEHKFALMVRKKI